MFSKSVAIFFTLSLALQASCHALIEPALGVTGQGARSDVERPTQQRLCGNVDVASAIKTSTALQVSGNTFNAVIQNFNTGVDGSRQITSAVVDPTGTGASFPVTATITANGIKNPTDVTTQQISGTLPANTVCTGGSDSKSCLISFTTAGGFGNCVLVSQGGASGGQAAAAPQVVVNNANAPAGQAQTGKKPHRKHKQQAGTRAARALLAGLKEREVTRFA